jgi:hypothetical protein
MRLDIGSDDDLRSVRRERVPDRNIKQEPIEKKAEPPSNRARSIVVFVSSKNAQHRTGSRRSLAGSMSGGRLLIFPLHRMSVMYGAAIICSQGSLESGFIPKRRRSLEKPEDSASCP